MLIAHCYTHSQCVLLHTYCQSLNCVNVYHWIACADCVLLDAVPARGCPLTQLAAGIWTATAASRPVNTSQKIPLRCVQVQQLLCISILLCISCPQTTHILICNQRYLLCAHRQYVAVSVLRQCVARSFERVCVHAIHRHSVAACASGPVH